MAAKQRMIDSAKFDLRDMAMSIAAFITVAALRYTQPLPLMMAVVFLIWIGAVCALALTDLTASSKSKHYGWFIWLLIAIASPAYKFFGHNDHPELYYLILGSMVCGVLTGYLVAAYPLEKWLKERTRNTDAARAGAAQN